MWRRCVTLPPKTSMPSLATGLPAAMSFSMSWESTGSVWERRRTPANASFVRFGLAIRTRRLSPWRLRSTANWLATRCSTGTRRRRTTGTGTSPFPTLRASGISTALYPHRVKAYFDLVPIMRLIHQTRTRNIAVNRMLDKFVPAAETCHVEQPDGVALPASFICATLCGQTYRNFSRELRNFAGMSRDSYRVFEYSRALE